MDKPNLITKNVREFRLGAFESDPSQTLYKSSFLMERYSGFISSGTFLGVWRDKKLIPHDTDIDLHLNVDKPSVSLVLELINVFEHNHCLLVRYITEENKMHQMVFKDMDNNGVLIDLEFYYRDGDKVTHVKPEGLQTMDYMGRIVYQFKGHRLYIPAEPDKYLTQRYGDWRTPYGKKGDWKEYTKCFKPW